MFLLFWGWGSKNMQWDIGNEYFLVCHYDYFHIMFVLRFTFNKKWFIFGNGGTQGIQLSKEQLRQLLQDDVPAVNEYYVDDIHISADGLSNVAYKRLSAGGAVVLRSEPQKRGRKFNKGLIIVSVVIATLIIIAMISAAITPSDTSRHISNNTGLTKDQADAIEKDAQENLASFPEVGDSYVQAGQSILDTANTIDCANYSYQYENLGISCDTGRQQQLSMGNDIIALGNCYRNINQASSYTVANLTQCITDIDIVAADYAVPIVSYMYDDTTNSKNTLIYNKATLQAAIDDINRGTYRP